MPADMNMDYAAVTARQQQVWSAGDFARIGATQVIVGENLCEALDINPGERVLDVAAGAGNAALAAARRFGEVTATDFVPHLLETASRRAEVEHLPLTTEVADAQDLPFPDASFDVVLSTFGAMFAPDQERTAAEMLRVCRKGGRVGMANWVPDGWAGEMFRTTAGYAPPPPGLRPATDWGREERLAELLGDGTSRLNATRRTAVLRFPSPEFAVDYMRTWFGPTKMAFESLDEEGAAGLARDLLAVFARYNRAGGGTLIVGADYLEVVAVRA